MQFPTNRRPSVICLSALAAALCAGVAAHAAPVTYQIDPSHTYPSFEADHMGVSIWRGKFDRSKGHVMLDRDSGTGSVDIDIDLSSVDFGEKKLDAWAIGKDFFDTSKFPHATYKGKLDGFANGAPTKVVGELNLHGVTRPVELRINSFKCIPHPMFKREMCGADAFATFDREAFGLTAGKDYGFRMDVSLRIQVEALAGTTAADVKKP
ncbi:MAG: YceI family protein [Dokdonella sp.]|uniref:YceI family protein n=1 Tax=Dokdonella sp. TaxID=2291710 RepID=UPI003265CD49